MASESERAQEPECAECGGRRVVTVDRAYGNEHYTEEEACSSCEGADPEVEQLYTEHGGEAGEVRWESRS